MSRPCQSQSAPCDADDDSHRRDCHLMFLLVFFLVLFFFLIFLFLMTNLIARGPMGA